MTLLYLITGTFALTFGLLAWIDIAYTLFH